MMAVAGLQKLLNLQLAEAQALQAQIAKVQQVRDRNQALADQPYTLCPNHRTYEECTHPELKAKYIAAKDSTLAKVRAADAALKRLRAQLATVEAQIKALQAQIAALSARG
jgi:hypothetical protein